MTTKSIAAPAPTSGLGHSLKPRQLTMMGLGSAIGAGLFLGSGAGVQAAGPAVLISYLVAGTLIIVVIAAEALGAAGLLFSIWPVIPVWVLALVFMVVFTGINLVGVRNFGEFEFWFAILKVAAIVLFLAVGAALLLGILPDVASPGLANVATDFAPAGLGGIAA